MVPTLTMLPTRNYRNGANAASVRLRDQPDRPPDRLPNQRCQRRRAEQYGANSTGRWRNDINTSTSSGFGVVYHSAGLLKLSTRSWIDSRLSVSTSKVTIRTMRCRLNFCCINRTVIMYGHCRISNCIINIVPY